MPHLALMEVNDHRNGQVPSLLGASSMPTRRCWERPWELLSLNRTKLPDYFSADTWPYEERNECHNTEHGCTLGYGQKVLSFIPDAVINNLEK